MDAQVIDRNEPTTPRERREVERDMVKWQAERAIDDMIREFGREYAIEFFNQRLTK